jgi:hypothetical protein
MEEVFIRVARDGGNGTAQDPESMMEKARSMNRARAGSQLQAPAAEAGQASSAELSIFASQNEEDEDALQFEGRKLTGLGLAGAHALALFKKRVNYAKRDVVATCCGMLLPAVVFILGLVIISALSKTLDEDPIQVSVAAVNTKQFGGPGYSTVPYVCTGATSNAGDNKLLPCKAAAGGTASLGAGVDTGAMRFLSLDKVEQTVVNEAGQTVIFPANSGFAFENGYNLGANGADDCRLGGAHGIPGYSTCAGLAAAGFAQFGSCPAERGDGARTSCEMSQMICSGASISGWSTPTGGTPPECPNALKAQSTVQCKYEAAAISVYTAFLKDTIDNAVNFPAKACPPTNVSNPVTGSPAYVFGLARQLISKSGHASFSDAAGGGSAFGGLVIDKERFFDYYLLQNTSYRFASPAYANAMTNVLLRSKSGAGASVSVTNHPLPITITARANATQNLTFFCTMFILIGFAFIPAYMIMFVVRERESHHNSKHQQLISGLSIVSYWISTWLFDVLSYLVPFTISIVAVVAFDFKGYTADGGLGYVAQMLLGYGCAVASFSYMMSFLFAKHTTAQLFIIIFSMLTGLVLMIAAFIMSLVASTQDINSTLLYVYRLFPPFGMGWGLLKITIPCLGSTDPTCFLKPKADVLGEWDVTGLTIFYLYAQSVAYLTIAIGIDVLQSYPAVWGALFGVTDPADPAFQEDDDVLAEAERVRSGASNSAGDLIQLDGLRKVYRGGKIAVRNLSFGIPAGECFGFLGINGAGKSTTLSMLTVSYAPLYATACSTARTSTHTQLAADAAHGCVRHHCCADAMR